MSVTAAVGTRNGAPGAPHIGRSVVRRPRTSASRHAAVRGLLRQYHRHGDLGARARLIQQYLPLVRRLARRHVGHGEQFEDLVQVGSIGLIKAIDRFELERGVDLATYAIPTIDGEIKRHLRDRAWPIRIPRRLQELDPTLRARIAELVDGQNGEFDRESLLDPGYELGESRVALARSFRVLDERERRGADEAGQVTSLHEFPPLVVERNRPLPQAIPAVRQRSILDCAWLSST